MLRLPETASTTDLRPKHDTLPRTNRWGGCRRLSKPAVWRPCAWPGAPNAHQAPMPSVNGLSAPRNLFLPVKKKKSDTQRRPGSAFGMQSDSPGFSRSPRSRPCRSLTRATLTAWRANSAPMPRHNHPHKRQACIAVALSSRSRTVLWSDAHLLIPMFEGATVALPCCGGRSHDDLPATVRRVVSALSLLAVCVADVVGVPEPWLCMRGSWVGCAAP